MTPSKEMKILLSLILSLVIMTTGCGQTAGESPLTPSPTPESNGLKIATSTTLIGTVVLELSGKLGEITSIIAPSKNPLDSEITAELLKPLENADLFIIMIFEHEAFPEELLKQVGGPDLKVIELDVPGEWMIPSVQLQATDAILEVLVRYDPDNGAYYEKRATDYRERVKVVETMAMAEFGKVMAERAKWGLPPPGVICSDTVADFVTWVGYNVIGTFGTPEQTNAEEMNEILEKGRSSGARLVVESFQDWKGLGTQVANSLGISLTFLTRYPGGFQDTGDWEKTILANVTKLVRLTCET